MESILLISVSPVLSNVIKATEDGMDRYRSMGGNICVKSDIYQIQNVRENCNVKSLYIVELHPDTSLLQSNQIPTQEAESPPVLRKEVKENVHSLKAGKFPGVDSIPSELFMNGGEAITTVLKLSLIHI